MEDQLPAGRGGVDLLGEALQSSGNVTTHQYVGTGLSTSTNGLSIYRKYEYVRCAAQIREIGNEGGSARTGGKAVPSEGARA